METHHITAKDICAAGKVPKDFGTTAIKARRCDFCGGCIFPGQVYRTRLARPGEYPDLPSFWARGEINVKPHEHLACTPYGRSLFLWILLENFGHGQRRYRWRPSQIRAQM